MPIYKKSLGADNSANGKIRRKKRKTLKKTCEFCAAFQPFIVDKKSITRVNLATASMYLSYDGFCFRYAPKPALKYQSTGKTLFYWLYTHLTFKDISIPNAPNWPVVTKDTWCLEFVEEKNA